MADRGVIEAIYIGGEAQKAMTGVRAILALDGRGLEGDRYANNAGTYSRPTSRWAHVTLIEAEAVEAVKRDYKIDLGPEATRRNLLTRNVPLNHLVGRRFRVGTVVLEGTRLCDPCNHLEQLTKTGVKLALTNRGGLCANVIAGGTISVGDEVVADRT